MYSLGCLIYAVHCKGNPPFKNHGSLSSVRDNAGKPLVGMERLEQDLRGEHGARTSPMIVELMSSSAS